MKKKKILFFVLALFFIYTVWLGYNIVMYKPFVSPSPSEPPYEIQGVYHIHTNLSDGHKKPEDIVRIAAQEPLDFIIFTDHGNPNFASLSLEGWKGKVLVLSGSELSVSRGHLVALGFDSPEKSFSQKTEDAAFEVASKGGFTVIAHPYSKVRWTWGGYAGFSGIEIINADTMTRKNIVSLLPFIPAILIKPEYAFLKTLSVPEKNIRKWDEMNRDHQVSGYFSVDAHLFYRPLLSFLHLHVLLDTPLSKDFASAKSQVLEALRNGRFFNSVHAAAEAKGFRFWGKEGGKFIAMGSAAPFKKHATLHINAPFPFSREIRLIHNGNAILASQAKEVEVEAQSPGTYRVEVLLKEPSPLNAKIPWILSNPIYLREEK